MQKIIIATDGFASGERALTYAIVLAVTFRAELIVVCSVDPGSQIAGLDVPAATGEMFAPRVVDLEEAALALLATATARAREAHVHARSMVLMGPPVRTIVDTANRLRADAVVLGTQAKRGLNRICMGSTAEGVLRRASVPVVVISPSIAATAASFARILVAVDGSDASDAAMGFAIGLAAESGARLSLLAVAETEEAGAEMAAYGYVSLDRREDIRVAARTMLNFNGARASAAGLAFDTHVVEGFAAEQILAEAVRGDAGLIVVGTHGGNGIGRWLLGSVAEGVVRDSPIPVAVLRDPSRDAERERAKGFLVPEPI